MEADNASDAANILEPITGDVSKEEIEDALTAEGGAFAPEPEFEPEPDIVNPEELEGDSSLTEGDFRTINTPFGPMTIPIPPVEELSNEFPEPEANAGDPVFNPPPPPDSGGSPPR